MLIKNHIHTQPPQTQRPHSTAQHSTAQHSTAQHSTAPHRTAQHSTAQHSTAQHSTAQHSTAQHTFHFSSSPFLYTHSLTHITRSPNHHTQLGYGVPDRVELIIAAKRAWVAMNPNTVGLRQQAVMGLDMMNAEKRSKRKNMIAVI